MHVDRLTSFYLTFPRPIVTLAMPLFQKVGLWGYQFLFRSGVWELDRGAGRGVSPSMPGEGFEERAVPAPQKIFLYLLSKRHILVDT